MPPPGEAPVKAAIRPRRSEPRGRESGMQKTKADISAATVDEVTADLSKDPRRERDEDAEGDDDDEEG